MLRIALQSKGRLNEESLGILRDSGIKVEESKRKLLSKALNYPIEVIYLRDDDIPHAVASGIADLGIVGHNEVMEKGENVKEIFKLGFGKCRLSLAIPKTENYTGLSYFNGKKVATSYPVILQKFFDENGIELSGGEIQKMAIARLFTRDFGLLIFDEPSSALDPLSEYEITKLILDGSNLTTTIIVAHRLSTIRNVDRIIVVDNGSIKETGTHDELMLLHGEYYEMFTKQAENYLDNAKNPST